MRTLLAVLFLTVFGTGVNAQERRAPVDAANAPKAVATPVEPDKRQWFEKTIDDILGGPDEDKVETEHR